MWVIYNLHVNAPELTLLTLQGRSTVLVYTLGVPGNVDILKQIPSKELQLLHRQEVLCKSVNVAVVHT